MDLSWIHVVILIFSGILVGFINTLAGGGTIISLSVFMFFGLPPQVANGTNRIAVLLQNITAVSNFAGKKLINWKKSLLLSIPIILGAIAGAFIAGIIDNTIIKYIFGVVILLVGLMLVFKPDRWLKEKEQLLSRPIQWWHYLLMFGIGIYGGFIHVGIGYMLLTFLVLASGNELVKANAMKNFLVLAYIPFSLVVFAMQGHVNWKFGLIHAIGNIIGAQIGSMIALKKGATLIRYIMLILIVVVILQLFGFINPEIVTEWLKSF
ncbi:sulfite exporter TauE/SafE family protein [Bacteroidales bacterium OttesenSCG-928-B11]|nr:sulfite exporter TauE/SafE family protein [Bacteroidales bacterium OttesenSCG-928-B11]